AEKRLIAIETLGERQKLRAGPDAEKGRPCTDRLNRNNLREFALCLMAVDQSRQRPDCRCFEKGLDGKFFAELFPDARQEFDCGDGIAAEIEEIVVESDWGLCQNTLPQCLQVGFEAAR